MFVDNGHPFVRAKLQSLLRPFGRTSPLWYLYILERHKTSADLKILGKRKRKLRTSC